MLYDLFCKHPHAVGETYLQHASAALAFGATMIAAGIACVVHAIMPRFFERTASEAVFRLYSQMTARRSVMTAPRGEIDYAI
jgi:hypothetical protein